MKTTIASILVFTGLVLYFGVEKPATVVETPKVSAAPEAEETRQAGASEFSQPTTIAPKESAVLPAAEAEPEAPVDSLTAEQMKNEIETLQQAIARENAIARLNEDSVSAEERQAWGKVLERLLELRSRNLRLGLEHARAALEAYKTQHEARVAEYVGSRS